MKIEVFIPAYNCAKTLPRTLASLEAQTDSDFSVCVVDDCNSDSLEGICARYPELNLRIVRNARNLGCGLSRQAAIDTSDADYLIPLDADDVLMPMAVSVFRQNARLRPDVDFFIAWAYNEVPDPCGGTGYVTLKDGLTLVSGKMYRAEFLREYGLRNCEEFSRFADDTYMNMLCFELGRSQVIPFPLYLYVHNPNSVTNINEGRDYWSGVVPKFIRCIEASSEMICRHKPIHEIRHFEGTLPYIRKVVAERGLPEEISAYNRLIDHLTRMGLSEKPEFAKL